MTCSGATIGMFQNIRQGLRIASFHFGSPASLVTRGTARNNCTIIDQHLAVRGRRLKNDVPAIATVPANRVTVPLSVHSRRCRSAVGSFTTGNGAANVNRIETTHNDIATVSAAASSYFDIAAGIFRFLDDGVTPMPATVTEDGARDVDVHTGNKD